MLSMLNEDVLDFGIDWNMMIKRRKDCHWGFQANYRLNGKGETGWIWLHFDEEAQS